MSADRSARIPPTPGARMRSNSVYGTDTNMVSRRVRVVTRAPKAAPVKRRFASTLDAIIAHERKMGRTAAPSSTFELTVSQRDHNNAQTFRPPPHADKVPPDYNGYATPFTPAQMVHMIDAPGKVEQVEQFTPKSRKIKVKPVERSVPLTEREIFLRNTRCEQESTAFLAVLGARPTRSVTRGYYRDDAQVEEGNLYVKGDSGPKVTRLRHYWPDKRYKRPLCGESGPLPRLLAVQVTEEECQVCLRLFNAGPEAQRAFRATLKKGAK